MSFITNIDNFVSLLVRYVNGQVTAKSFVDSYQTEFERSLEEQNEYIDKAEEKLGLSKFRYEDYEHYIALYEAHNNEIRGLSYKMEGFVKAEAYPIMDTLEKIITEIYTSCNCYWEESEMGADMEYNSTSIIDEKTLLNETKTRFEKIEIEISKLDSIYKGSFQNYVATLNVR